MRYYLDQSDSIKIIGGKYNSTRGKKIDIFWIKLKKLFLRKKHWLVVL